MTKPFLQLESTGSLPDQIYAQIVEAILRGDFAPSGKLPTESELCTQFNVSRPTVREALSHLRADGVIDSRRGAGSFIIKSPSAAAIVANTPVKNFADIERYYTFRSWLEAGAAAGAAEFHEVSDLEEINAAMEALNKTMREGNQGIPEDLRFHKAIARASKNPFFFNAIDTTVAPIREFFELARSVTDKKSQERVRVTGSEHQVIVDAITRRSAEDAAQAVRIHVLNAKRRIFESIPVLQNR